jgi:DNA repair exonuclease SbcCD ATPase subunit
MDIKKYITNKDIELSNDDFNIDKLENDLRKGYVLSSEVDERVSNAIKEAQSTSKAEYDKLKSQFDEVQNSLTDYEKRNSDLAEKNKVLGLENVMTRAGFKEEDFKDISAMRYSMYEDLDDVKAIESIKEKYKNTYFPEPVVEVKPKNDLPINNGVSTPTEPKVNRMTSIKDLIMKK